ncbi:MULTISPECIES: helix-turn-helix domain-containing protein [Enterococcus]|uniref:helix-turn-helix domain-containing protein n=1 Tax=Enterococcus TaxID=1350 RepID=UPI001E3A4B3E|nr:helix-turn-helix transcriptional regulator [Enterococcus gallinarum]MDO6299102.1 helix-turn-helix transcriptional regulator [Enterococcus gallinarum]
MFGLVQPDKVKVGQRIKELKDEMSLSFTELGNRLGLKKPTISSYVQGYALAPMSVINQLSSISGKPVGWFYFGHVEDYIREYLFLIGQKQIVDDHPEIIEKIKQEFYTGEFKNPAWENELGYPLEEFIQECFVEYSSEIMKDYVVEITKEVLEGSKTLNKLSSKAKEEAVTILSSGIIDYIEMSGEIKYGEKDRIAKMVKESIKTFDVKQDLTFNDSYLIGKLINILGTDEDTELFLSSLSMIFTDKHFSTRFGGEELVEIFQSMRPALIKLYREKTPDEFYDWFEK